MRSCASASTPDIAGATSDGAPHSCWPHAADCCAHGWQPACLDRRSPPSLACSAPRPPCPPVDTACCSNDHPTRCDNPDSHVPSSTPHTRTAEEATAATQGDRYSDTAPLASRQACETAAHSACEPTPGWPRSTPPG